jgi:hypothetical protein
MIITRALLSTLVVASPFVAACGSADPPSTGGVDAITLSDVVGDDTVAAPDSDPPRPDVRTDVRVTPDDIVDAIDPSDTAAGPRNLDRFSHKNHAAI